VFCSSHEIKVSTALHRFLFAGLLCREKSAKANSVSRNCPVNGHVLQQVGLLPEGLAAVRTIEGFLPGVGSHVHLDVALVEEPAVADLAGVKFRVVS
jgi:hypothetical protein